VLQAANRAAHPTFVFTVPAIRPRSGGTQRAFHPP
jgi:hypothetical protein